MTDARAHDALDAALDRLVQGEPASAPEGLDPLIQTARAAREAFRIEVPEGVVSAHIVALTGATILEHRRPRHRVAMVLIAAAITALLVGGAAVSASASALPGQLLYPVKRAVEKIELSIHRAPASRARLHLEFAQRRLSELSTLEALRRSGEKVDVGAAMSAYQSELNAAQDALAADRSDPGYDALAAAVDEQLQRHLVVLSALKSEALPGPAQSAIDVAIQHVNQAHSALTREPIPGEKPKPFPSNGKTPGPRVTPSRGSRSR